MCVCVVPCDLMLRLCECVFGCLALLSAELSLPGRTGVSESFLEDSTDRAANKHENWDDLAGNVADDFLHHGDGRVRWDSWMLGRVEPSVFEHVSLGRFRMGRARV